MRVTELTAGSLQDEVQRVTLRAIGPMDNGTFRLEVGGVRVDGGGRNRVDADNDDRYWTSQLGANSTAEEVRVRVQCRTFPAENLIIPRLLMAS